MQMNYAFNVMQMFLEFSFLYMQAWEPTNKHLLLNDFHAFSAHFASSQGMTQSDANYFK